MEEALGLVIIRSKELSAVPLYRRQLVGTQFVAGSFERRILPPTDGQIAGEDRRPETRTLL